VIWASIQRQGMKADLSWERSAEKYAGLYRMLYRKGCLTNDTRRRHQAL
jgi:glycogen synthase